MQLTSESNAANTGRLAKRRRQGVKLSSWAMIAAGHDVTAVGLRRDAVGIDQVRWTCGEARGPIKVQRSVIGALLFEVSLPPWILASLARGALDSELLGWRGLRIPCAILSTYVLRRSLKIHEDTRIYG